MIFETTIDLNIDAFIPDSYISNEFQNWIFTSVLPVLRVSRSMTICWKS